MKTKENIIREALNLFSIKGFNAVSVRDISSAVGIKASSLYNHFENKQDIFDTIVNKGSKRINTFFKKFCVKPKFLESEITKFKELSDNDFFNIHFEVFRFYLEDAFIVQFRRMLEIERFNNSEISKLYRKIFIDTIIDYEHKIFSVLIKLDIIENKDPYVLALQFFSPIFLLFSNYEKLSDQELSLLRNHIIDFRHTYELKG